MSTKFRCPYGSQLASHSNRKKPPRYNGSMRFRSQWRGCKNLFLRLFLTRNVQISILRRIAAEYIAQIQ